MDLPETLLAVVSGTENCLVVLGRTILGGMFPYKSLKFWDIISIGISIFFPVIIKTSLTCSFVALFLSSTECYTRAWVFHFVDVPKES